MRSGVVLTVSNSSSYETSLPGANVARKWSSRSGTTAKKTSTPSSIWRLAIAAARCVLPQPGGPASSSQPGGSSAYRRHFSSEIARLWRACSPSSSRPCGRKFSKVRSARDPRWLRRRRRSRNSPRRHVQGIARPKSGSPTGTSRRTKPWSRQIGQLGSGSGSASPSPMRALSRGRMRAMASPSRSISGLVYRKIQELGGAFQEQELDLAGRPIAVLGDDDVGDAFLIGVRVVLLVAINEQHDVCILLERARLAQIGQLRDVRRALLDRTAELAQGENRHAQLASE